MKKIFLYFALLLPVTGNAETVYMAGDSTMAIKPEMSFPENGWGMPFARFFDESVTVENRAMNGRSTRTFIEEGRWDSIEKALQPGDFVIIQFGHNDASESKKDRYTPPDQYKANLSRFIRETRARGAHPLLMSPITRRYFNDDGTIKQTHAKYAPLSREVAKAEKVDFIDMEVVTREHFQQQGDENSALRFLHIKPDTHPNYPNGVRDDTHLNQLGAREVAQIALREMKKIGHPLIEKLRTPRPKHLTFSYE